MPYDIRFFLNEGILESIFHDVVTADDIVGVYRDMLRNAACRGAYLWLHDFFRATRKISREEVLLLPERLNDISRLHGVEVGKIKRAIVTNKDFPDFQIVEEAARRVGQVVCAFTTRDAAICWLKGVRNSGGGMSM